MKTRNCFIDTDIIMKIGGYKKQKLLRGILSSYHYNLYLHEYVVSQELIYGSGALEQLYDMINAGEITIMYEKDLSKDEIREYMSTLHLLASEMNVDLHKKRDHNAGEVKSMAMAFAKDFDYFISDDRDARVAAKKHLQKIDGSYLQTIRMKDVILHIKNLTDVLGVDRKMVRQLYLYGTNPKLAREQVEARKLQMINDKLKWEFDTELWPIKCK